MYAVVSPAKKLVSPTRALDTTKPVFSDATQALVEIMQTKTPDDLRALMGISENLSVLNVERYALFGQGQPRTPAALTFAGDTYQGLDAATLSDADLAYAQVHLGILSGLYGILRPLDAMEPYRLEMGTKLATSKGRTLYDYWGEGITEELNCRISESGSPYLVNLASNEYFSAVKSKLVEGTIITPVFKDVRKGTAKVISFLAKKARGMMARYLIETRATRPESVTLFDRAGYQYQPELSTETAPVFVRPEMP